MSARRQGAETWRADLRHRHLRRLLILAAVGLQCRCFSTEECRTAAHGRSTVVDSGCVGWLC